MMPTAARMISAIILAAAAWMAGEMVKPAFPEGKDFGWFSVINPALGLLVGWIVIGSRTGRGISAAISNGLTGTAALVFWALFLQAFNEMLRIALKSRYDGPIEALVDVFNIGLKFGEYLLTAPIMIVLIGGGILAALLAEFGGRHWR